MPLIQHSGKQRQADLCKFKTSLVYRMSSRTAKDTQRNSIKQTNKQTKTKKNNQATKKINKRKQRNKNFCLNERATTHSDTPVTVSEVLPTNMDMLSIFNITTEVSMRVIPP